MTPEHDKKLCDDFGEIFRDRNGDMRTTAMCWGFDVDDGWFNLIYDLCVELNKCDPIPVATQVKEKYGTLGFYIYNGSDRAYDLIEIAEHKSGKTCETCGKPGLTRGEMWFKTLCDEHATEYNG